MSSKFDTDDFKEIVGMRNFETEAQAQRYIENRPRPSEELMQHIVDYVKQGFSGPLTLAADVGCGSGQATLLLSKHFQQVIGADISQSQIDVAKTQQTSNVKFVVSPAESLPLSPESVQLLTVFVAIHYFDLDKFISEVSRVLCPAGVIALSCYENGEVIYGDATITANMFQDAMISIVKELVPEYYDKFSGDLPKVLDMYTSFQEKFGYNDIKSFECPVTRDFNLNGLCEFFRSTGMVQNYAEKNGEEAVQKMVDIYRKKVEQLMKDVGIPVDAKFLFKITYVTVMSRKP